MDFENIDDIYNIAFKCIESGLREAMDKGVKLAKKYINDKFYGSYKNPTVYKRLNKMIDCIDVKFKVSSNEITAELFIKDGLHPKSNSWTNRTYEEIVEWFAEGAYGRSEGYDVIKYTESQLDDAKIILNTIKKSLTDAGFTVQ